MTDINSKEIYLVDIRVNLCTKKCTEEIKIKKERKKERKKILAKSIGDLSLNRHEDD